MKIITICNRIIEYSFYALFFFVPLILNGDTSEIFEFNKMWLTFGITLIIGSVWAIKSILQGGIRIQKTPLDIPIALFLISQIVSTIFSLDTHISLWGYYSRFNGGLFSIISYIFLYYAFVSNIFYSSSEAMPNREASSLPAGRVDRSRTIVKRTLLACLAGGLAVVIWGLPSHFGYDPTCYIFRGKLDVSCWTTAFQPMIRIFSTLGQPNWLAAYLSILIPLSISMFWGNLISQQKSDKSIKGQVVSSMGKLYSLNTLYLILATFFFVAVLFTGSRSGFASLLVGLGIFFLLSNQKMLILKFVAIPLLVLSLLFGTPVDAQIKQITDKFLSYITSAGPARQQPEPQAMAGGSSLESGGTESGKIRLIVWRGAIDAWLHYPIFGSGVETFAFAYYKYRPVAHNLTSEWDYLYNKAHNEYLNYLTTTGIFGLGSYLLMIGSFLFFAYVILKPKAEGSRQILSGVYPELSRRAQNDSMNSTLILGLLAGYVSILVSNFLGFSVVIMNIFLFMIPAFVFVLSDIINLEKSFVFPAYSSSDVRQLADESRSSSRQSLNNINIFQWAGVSTIILTSLFFIFTLYRFWLADTYYSEGYNLDRAGIYKDAYIKLADAAEMRPSEPTFLDELSYNTTILAVTFASLKDENASAAQKDQEKIASYTAELTKNAVLLSDKITTEHPNNIVFWKTRIRILNLISQENKKYIPLALESAQKAAALAPTDAKIRYSLAILYGQNKEPQKAIKTLQQAIVLKPDYRDAYYALALFYHNVATDKNSRVIDSALQEKAIQTMQYILDHISPNDKGAKKALETWGK